MTVSLALILFINPASAEVHDIGGTDHWRVAFSEKEGVPKMCVATGFYKSGDRIYMALYPGGKFAIGWSHDDFLEEPKKKIRFKVFADKTMIFNGRGIVSKSGSTVQFPLGPLDKNKYRAALQIANSNTLTFKSFNGTSRFNLKGSSKTIDMLVDCASKGFNDKPKSTVSSAFRSS